MPVQATVSCRKEGRRRRGLLSLGPLGFQGLRTAAACGEPAARPLHRLPLSGGLSEGSMCRGADSLQRPDGPVSETGPQQRHRSQREAPQRGISQQGAPRLDVLGVINMIQIFTLSEHLAECQGRPASC